MQQESVPLGAMQQESAKAISHDEEGTICLYPSKRCENPRVMKSNGQLHKFCQLHRDKANYNQRQLESKRRERLEQIRKSGASKVSPGKSTEEEFELDEEDIRLIEEVAAANISDGQSLNQ